jgi:CheY-like chemotaxis protein
MASVAAHGYLLVVEDDPLTRESVCEMLSEAGYPVATATNGAEALLHLRSNPPPCLILLDLMMPVMTGQEFRFEQLKDPDLARIPVIIVSAVDTGDLLQKLRAEDCLPKPFRMGQLLESVSRYC